MSTAFEYTFFVVMLAFCALVAIVTLVFVIRRVFDRQAGEIGGWEARGALGRIAAVARITAAEGFRIRTALAFVAVIAALGGVNALVRAHVESGRVQQLVATASVIVFLVVALFVLADAFRGRFATGAAALLLVVIPTLWWTAKGDGTIKGEIQMFISWSLGLTAAGLSLLTILFSCRTLSREIVDRQIYGVVTKPIPRWQIVAGKWCGVMTMNVVLLLIACLLTYVGTIAKAERFKSALAHDLSTYGDLTPAQAAAAVTALEDVKGMGGKGYDSPVLPVLAGALGRTTDQIADMLLRLPEPTRVNLRRFDELRRQVLISRGWVSPEIPDLAVEIKKRYLELVREGRAPEDWTPREIRDQIQAEMVQRYCTVAPGEARQWRLQGPKPERGRDFLLSIRFKITTPGKLMDVDTPLGPLEEDTLLSAWGLGDPAKPTFFKGTAAHPVSTFNEYEIPTASIEPDGTVIINYANIDPRRQEAVFDFPYALQVLYRVGSFELNMMQAFLAMLIPLACLAAFGVTASTFLSFPVAALIVLTMAAVSIGIGFVAESLGTTPEYYIPGETDWLFDLRKGSVDALGWALAIGDAEPSRQFIEGRAIGWDTLLEKSWKFALLKNGVVLLIGVLVFRRRELAAVIA